MDYVKTIERQIELLEKLNDNLYDPNISMLITQMAEKAFYISMNQRRSDKKRG